MSIDPMRLFGMAWLKAFVLKQWSDIKGNVKYGLILFFITGGGGSAFIAWLTSHLQKVRGIQQQDRIGYVILATMIFLDIMVSALLFFVVFSADRNGVTSPAGHLFTKDEVSEQSSLAASTLTPALPLPVDLRGKVMEVYSFKFDSIPSMSRQYVLLRVNIVNHGPDEATILTAALSIKLGKYNAELQVIEIPTTWRIRKPKPNLLNVGFDDFEISPRLGDNAHDEIYKKGHPREGWVAFEHYVFGTREYPNAQFDLTLTDSLGGTHVISRPAGVYQTTGLVVDVPQTAQPSGQ